MVGAVLGMAGRRSGGVGLATREGLTWKRSRGGVACALGPVVGNIGSQSKPLYKP